MLHPKMDCTSGGGGGVVYVYGPDCVSMRPDTTEGKEKWSNYVSTQQLHPVRGTEVRESQHFKNIMSTAALAKCNMSLYLPVSCVKNCPKCSGF